MSKEKESVIDEAFTNLLLAGIETIQQTLLSSKTDKEKLELIINTTHQMGWWAEFNWKQLVNEFGKKEDLR